MQMLAPVVIETGTISEYTSEMSVEDAVAEFSRQGIDISPTLDMLVMVDNMSSFTLSLGYKTYKFTII